MSKPKKKPVIPPKFNLAAYNKCASWGLKEWAAALTIRRNIRQPWRRGFTEDEFKNEPEPYMTILRVAANQILSNPSDTNLDVIPFNERPCYMFLPIRDQSPADYFAGVDTFNEDQGYKEWVDRKNYINENLDVFTCENENRDHDYDVRKKMVAREIEKFSETPAWKMHEECSEKIDFTFGNHLLFIAVDLRASNEVLKEEFKNWLGKTRKEIGGVKPQILSFTEKDFRKWHKNHLLQYLDLTFWGDVNNYNFSNKELCDLIFPYGDADENSVRNKTRKDALKVISDEYVFALNNQLSRPTIEPK